MGDHDAWSDQSPENGEPLNRLVVRQIHVERVACIPANFLPGAKAVCRFQPGTTAGTQCQAFGSSSHRVGDPDFLYLIHGRHGPRPRPPPNLHRSLRVFSPTRFQVRRFSLQELHLIPGQRRSTEKTDESTRGRTFPLLPFHGRVAARAFTPRVTLPNRVFELHRVSLYR